MSGFNKIHPKQNNLPNLDLLYSRLTSHLRWSNLLFFRGHTKLQSITGVKSEHQEPTTTELKDYSKSNKTYIILVSANRCYICKYSVYSPYDLKSCFRIASASTCLELSSATAFASFRSAGFSFRKHNSRTSPLCNFIMEVFDAAR